MKSDIYLVIFYLVYNKVITIRRWEAMVTGMWAYKFNIIVWKIYIIITIFHFYIYSWKKVDEMIRLNACRI